MNTFLTPLGLISVIPAQVADVDEMLAILTGAGRWLAERGIDQWGPAQFSRERCAAAVERGEAYVAKLGAEVIATLRLRTSDTSLWVVRPDDALYVHALAVKRVYAGHQVGAGILRWAGHQAASADRKFLRLDCMAANLALRNYYLKSGFTLVGGAQKHGWNAALFERRATLIEEVPK